MISLLTVLLFLIMGLADKEVKLTEGVMPGNLAPVSNWQGVDIIDNNCVLVQFWSSSEPQSRLENVKMHNMISQSKSGSLKLVSISLDENEAVYKGMIRFDQIDDSTQFHVSSLNDAQMFNKYKLDAKAGNWLINSDGVIIATNVDPDDIRDLI